MPRKRRLPGYRWRTLAHGRGDSPHTRHEQECDGTEGVCFDELVIDDWLHIEQMDTRRWWAHIGDLTLWITIPAKGEPDVFAQRESGDLA